MNYITSCPECKTQFLLSTEHLKAYRGKVQCGHCEHVFNAKNRLTEVPDDIQNAEEYQASLQNAAQVEDYENFLESSPIEEIEIGDSTNYVEETPPPAPEIVEKAPAKPKIIEDLSTDPKFSKKKVKLSIWLTLLSLLLLIAAGLQSVYFMRTQIAADYPQFKPMLVQACGFIGCDVPLPKTLSLLQIDDSDMQEDENYQGVINFSSSLINHANFAQAYPNIELTLTNADDQPVLRRIIKPNEYVQNKTDFSAGIAAHEEMRIKLPIHASDIAVAGYRVLLVY